jgi:hypothetical protein
MIRFPMRLTAPIAVFHNLPFCESAVSAIAARMPIDY